MPFSCNICTANDRVLLYLLYDISCCSFGYKGSQETIKSKESYEKWRQKVNGIADKCDELQLMYFMHYYAALFVYIFIILV